MSEELKQCPFCRSGDAVEFGKIDNVGSWMVECVAELDGCGAMSGLYESESEAISAWNRRATVELSESDIERIARKILNYSEYQGLPTFIKPLCRAIIAAQRGLK